MTDATFCPPDLITFARLDDRGLVGVGQHIIDRRTALECRAVPVPDDEFCHQRGTEPH